MDTHSALRTPHSALRAFLRLVMVLPVLSGGCDPGEGVVKETGGDTDYTPPPTFQSIELPAFSGSGTCFAESDEVDLDGMGIDDYETIGYNGSSEPQESEGEYVTTSREHHTPCIGTTNARGASPGTGTISPKATDAWIATGGITSLAYCYPDYANNCDEGQVSNSCSGQYRVEITSSGLCNDFNDVRVDLAIQDYKAMRRVNAETDCSAGSGRFILLGTRAVDLDRDGQLSVTYLPMQVSGTGVMTTKAWITDIDAVSLVSGKTLRVIKVNDAFRITSSDLLENASTVSYAITGNHDFSTGEVMGNSPFVVSEIDPDDVGDYVLDMTWQCGTGGTSITQPAGYQFGLSDIGCDAVQKMTMRFLTSPGRVEIEQYGNPNARKVLPTTQVEDGDAFSYDIGTFHLSGVVISTSPTQAVVRLDSIEDQGVDVCETGTYYFSRE